MQSKTWRGTFQEAEDDFYSLYSPLSSSASSTSSSKPSPSTTPPSSPLLLPQKVLDLECCNTLNLPRILCLHGGGTNARIFRTQCRSLRARLAPYFRLVFADAPFIAQPGPDVTSVYANWGPFLSWLRPGSRPALGYTAVETDAADLERISEWIEAAIYEDNKAGATGDFIGLLGFSQGAKLAASLLLEQQRQNQKSKWQVSSGSYAQTHIYEIHFRFAVLLAGRAPLVPTNLHRRDSWQAWSLDSDILQLPTIHVHGLQDTALSLHRELLRKYCKKDSTRVIEWNGDHRVPIRSKDIDAIVFKILDVVKI